MQLELSICIFFFIPIQLIQMKNILVISFFFFSTCLFSQQSDTLVEKFSIHAQTTVINQNKLQFNAKYSGDNSLKTEKESQTSLTSTLFLGAKLWKNASIFSNIEIAGGSGLSSTLGIGNATNGETFRVGNPSPQIYLARLFFRQLFPLSLSSKENKSPYFHHHSDFNQLAEYVPEKYFSIMIGKVAIADYFDDNSYSHDPRTQFISWSLMSNGAWDYPANTRGYTPSIVLEFIQPNDEFRYGMSLVPTFANGNTMDWNIGKAMSHTIEYTRNYQWSNRKGALRILGFYTSANMGNYTQAIQLQPINPKIEDTRNYKNHKFGFGINAEQTINSYLGVFGRASWNDGKNETWNFTEIDNSVSLGLQINGDKWKRQQDVVGLAYVSSGLSKEHQNYLNAGGKGFILGDGDLNYKRENLLEIYYSLSLVPRSMYLTGFYQCLFQPGFNADRSGPVNIFSIRMHVRI